MTGPSEPEDQVAKPAPKDPFEPMPSAPAPAEPDRAAVARPRTVDRAFIVWVAFAVLLLAIAVLFLTVSAASLEDAIRTAFRQQNRAFTEDEVSAGAAFIRSVGIGFNVVFAIAVGGCAYAMRAGRNWARITLCVLGGVAVVAGLFGLGGSLLFTLVELALIVMGAIFMFRKEAAAYFTPYRVPGTR